MSQALAAAVIALVSADPQPNVDTWINDNQISLVFNVPVVEHSVVVTDSKGCNVNQSEEISGTRAVVVHMKACEIMGYPGGPMTVKYTVNGEAGEYHLHIRHHH